MKLQFSTQVFEEQKYNTMSKFDENPRSGSKIAQCEQADGRKYGQTRRK